MIDVMTCFFHLFILLFPHVDISKVKLLYPVGIDQTFEKNGNCVDCTGLALNFIDELDLLLPEVLLFGFPFEGWQNYIG